MEGYKFMKKVIEKLIVSYGTKLCSIAVMVEAVTPLCCRSLWYQPKEPESIELLKNKRKN